jgi:hypothetical protein
MSFDPALAFIHCAHCDTNTLPHATGNGWYHCDVCSKDTNSGIRPVAGNVGSLTRKAARGRTPVPAGSLMGV